MLNIRRETNRFGNVRFDRSCKQNEEKEKEKEDEQREMRDDNNADRFVHWTKLKAIRLNKETIDSTDLTGKNDI